MERWYVRKLKEGLETKHFIILVGPRQTGKTTALTQLNQYLKAEGKAVAYINLENPLVLQEVNKHPEHLLNYTDFFRLPEGEKLFLLVDEVQYAADPSNLLKFLYDEYHDRLKIIATGSSSFYIDRKFGDSMMGRKRLVQSGTLNFTEFLHFSGNDALMDELDKLAQNPQYRSLQEPKLKNLLEQYLTYGGYPEVVLATDEKEKQMVLQGIGTSIIKKDLLDSGLTDDLKFAQFLRLLAGETGKQTNLNSISKSLKINNKKAEEMMYVARKSFIIETISPFFRNFRKELTKMPKAYFIDSGLRNFLINDFRRPSLRQDKGEVLENYVFRLLWDSYSTDQLHHWRTADQYEVDFVIENNREKGMAWEVKWDGETSLSSGQKKFAETYENFPLKKLCWQNPDANSIEILSVAGGTKQG
ncbi:MAG: ATP-binding protein [Bacteroidia bacterium]